MNSVQNSGHRRGSFATMKNNHNRNNSATMSNNSSSSSLGSPNSTTTTTTSNNIVDQQQFIFHAPDPHRVSLDPHHHHHSLIDFRGGSGSLLTFDHPSTAWEDFNGGWDGPVGNTKGANPPDPSTQEFDAVYHPTAKDTPKRPNLGESPQQPQKKQCNSSGSAATNSKPTTNKTAAKSVLESKDPQSIAAKNRRERISERLKTLQELVPNGSKVDLVTMLEKAISYVKFLQLQVKVLATDEFWPAQGARAPDISQVKEAIDAILSTQRARKSSSSNSTSQ